jgi:hypothetical protein
MTRVLTGTVCAAALLLLGAGAASAAPQGNLQQKCINKINKDMIKVQAAQGKLNAGCVKDAVKTGSSAETCINADVKNKVGGKAAKTVSDEQKKCVGLSPQPEFAYLSAGTANAAAIGAEKNLIHDVFGNPVDAGLFLCDTFPQECLCQRQAIDRVEKAVRAMSKIFVKCKKAALAIGKDPFLAGAASASDIAECVTNGTIGLSVEADTKTKVSSAFGQLDATIANFCTAGGTDEFGGGDCATLTGGPLGDCLEQRARCRFCEMVNQGDGLAIDCSAWSGGTCP